MRNSPILAAADVSFSYGKAAQAFCVTGWDAAFNRGAVTALTGSSGCGKSTRLYLLATLLQLDSGSVHLDGQPIHNLPDAAKSALRARRFGFVFQDAALDPTRTVLDNITETALYAGTSRHHCRARAARLMARFGVEVPLTRRPGQISGGQAQRIALCRALLTDPEIIFADEPTGNLDPHSARVVLESFADHARSGGTVIIVTHDPSIADWADHHVQLDAALSSVGES